MGVNDSFRFEKLNNDSDHFTIHPSLVIIIYVESIRRNVQFTLDVVINDEAKGIVGFFFIKFRRRNFYYIDLA